MGYTHIDNLYKDQTILLFREVYALEKIHGTSAHISWRDGKLHFYAGGESHSNFVALFDQTALAEHFTRMRNDTVIVHGEAYGGKQQRQAWRYGDKLRFVAFDVRVGDTWLSIPNAEALVKSIGLEFVDYARVQTDLDTLNAERDKPSTQAKRNGIIGDQPREGVVLRPILEVTLNNGDRICAKHKRAEERETRTDRPVVDPAKLTVLAAAEAIATEWVTYTRLEHVMDHLRAALGGPLDMSHTPLVIKEMTADVLREGSGEIVDSPDARKAIATHTAKLYKKHITTIKVPA